MSSLTSLVQAGGFVFAPASRAETPSSTTAMWSHHNEDIEAPLVGQDRRPHEGSRNLLSADAELSWHLLRKRRMLLLEESGSHDTSLDAEQYQPLRVKSGCNHCKAAEGRKWVLVFRQTSPFTFDPSNDWEQAKLLNADDDRSPNYSVLRNVSETLDWNASDGKFTLMITFPKDFPGLSNIWKQDSSPATAMTEKGLVDGYEELEVEWNSTWNGLHLSAHASSYLGGAGGALWYAIAAKSSSGFMQGFPGPYTLNGGQNVSQVELYVCKVVPAMLPAPLRTECTLELFGSNCSKKCSSEYHCSGNGWCSDDGFCQCLEGHHGANCESVETGQTCADGFLQPTCRVCTDDLFGDACSIECNSAITCNERGYCSEEGNCMCLDGYTGVHCNECDNGQYGADCEIELSTIPYRLGGKCFGNGTCLCPLENAGSWCAQCSEGWFGDHCDVSCASQTTCSGNGRCCSDGSCICKDGWGGVNCDIGAVGLFPRQSNRSIESSTNGGTNWRSVECSSHQSCSSRGRCTWWGLCECGLKYSGHACQQCAFGFFGVECDVYCEAATTCHGHGTCSAQGACICTSGFEGPNCQDVACDLGFFGADCSIECERHASCSSEGRCRSAGDCVCEESFADVECASCEGNAYGRDCDNACHHATTCSGRGRCLGGTGSGIPASDGNTNGFCNINTPGSGSNCLYETVDNDVCECREGSTGHDCSKCVPGYYGHECRIRCFDVETCHGNGFCDNDGSCFCFLGFTGPDCAMCDSSFGQQCLNQCALKSCSGGHCSGDGNCICPDNFTGDHCEDCKSDVYGTRCSEICQASTTCSTRGRCTADGRCTCSKGFVGPDCSFCESGLYGPECEHSCSSKQSHSSQRRCDLSGSFLCLFEGSGVTCNECASGYFGEHCNLPCNSSMTCNGNGICSANGTCLCREGFGGPNCSACNAGLVGSKCQVRTDLYNVYAAPDYVAFFPTSDMAMSFLSSSNQSSNSTLILPMFIERASTCETGRATGNGECKCFLTGAGDTCKSCSPGSQGSNCDVKCDWNETCSSHGRCDGVGSCVCYQGWKGSDCSQTECAVDAYGEDCEANCMRNSTSCDNGRCLGDGSCQCLSDVFVGALCNECSNGGFGADCTARSCSWNTSCSGHGRCQGHGRCTCIGGWMGSACDLCLPGHFGSNCDQMCTDADNCSSHGRCGSDGECVCDSGFDGRTCRSCSKTFGNDGPTNAACHESCSASSTCLGSGACLPNPVSVNIPPSCSCFPTFDCSRVRNELARNIKNWEKICDCSNGDSESIIPTTQMCGNVPIKNECLESCSGDDLQECQDEFSACLAALGQDGACECLGRLRKCTVDVGCQNLSDESLKLLCGALHCSAAQCQLFYPRHTTCDWDAHALCNEELHQCLRTPQATILTGDLCGYNRGSKCGDSYEAEEAKYAERCKCYREHNETFENFPTKSCDPNATAFGLQYFLVDHLQTWLPETKGLGDGWIGESFAFSSLLKADGTSHLSLREMTDLIEPDTTTATVATQVDTPIPSAPLNFSVVYRYNDRACLSACMKPSIQDARMQSIAHDCAICGDSVLMPGREECDDGNRIDHDGCSWDCKIELPEFVNSTVIKSAPASSLGQVAVMWNHTYLSVQAYNNDFLWKVHGYSIQVNRTVCEVIASNTNAENRNCITSIHEDFIPYDNCTALQCVYIVSGIESGEYLEIDVAGLNKAGPGMPSIHTLRWIYLPSEDVQLSSVELARPAGSDPLDGNQIQLQWFPPSDTGYGDTCNPSIGCNTELNVPISGYSIEVSSCSDFRHGDDLCFYHYLFLEPGNISDLLSVLSGPYNDTFLGDYTSMTGNKTFDAFEDAKSAAMADPEAGGITKNSAGIFTLRRGTEPIHSPSNETSWIKSIETQNRKQFYYPVKYNLSFPLHPGFVYHYRVRPFTFFGTSILVETITSQFGVMPVGIPMVTYPIRFPIPIAVTSSGTQVWQDTVVASHELIQVLGFPVVLDKSDDLVISVSPENFYGQNLTSIADMLNVTRTSLTSGTTFVFTPPILTLHQARRCGDCLLRFTLRFRRWVSKSISFSVQYFTYPDAQLITLFPTSGPVHGGTLIKLSIIDFEGPQTRTGAGIASLSSMQTKNDFQNDTSIVMIVGVARTPAIVMKYTPGPLQGNRRRFDIEIETPDQQSIITAQGGAIASVSIQKTGNAIPISTAQASLLFQYVGTKILESLPPAGFLNPGSGGQDVMLKVANLPKTLSSQNTNVSIEHIQCSISEFGTPSSSDLGTMTIIVVKFPELSYDFLGDLSVNLTGDGLKSPLRTKWRYIPPPFPFFDTDTVVFADRPGQWVPAAAKGFFGAFVIRNLNAKFGIPFDRLNVSFGGISGTVLNVREIGFDVHVQVQTPNRMSPGFYTTNVTAWGDQRTPLATVNYINDGITLFEVEFRDLTDPRVISMGPTVGPARGGTIVVVGIMSFSSLLTTASSNPGDVRANFTSIRNGITTMISDEPVLGLLSAYDWRERTNMYEKITGMPEIASFMLGINTVLQDTYAAIFEDTLTSVAQMSLDLEKGLKETAFVFLLTPELQKNNITTDTTISISHGPSWDTSVQSRFVFASLPTGLSVISASTDEGELRSGLKGNVRISIVLSNFDIVYKASDIRVHFGGKSLEVSRLLHSTQASTKLFVVVPPNLPDVISVKVHPQWAPSNFGQFEFEYYDDVVPEVVTYNPYQAYQDGGIEIMFDLILFPNVAASQTTLIVRQGLTVAGEVIAQSKTISRGTTVVTFLLPSASVGLATLSVVGGGKSTNPVFIEYVAVPKTSPVVSRVWPTIGSSNGGDSMDIFLQNFKQVQDMDSIIMTLSFLGVLDGNETTIELLPDRSKMILKNSDLRQTRFSFSMPAVPLAATGMSAVARVWGLQNASLVADHPITYRDDNLAKILYVLPRSEKADQVAMVELSIAKFGTVQSPNTPELYIAMESHTGVDMVGCSESCPPFYPVKLIRLAQTTDIDGYVKTNVKLELRSKDQIPGKASVVLSNCKAKGACNKKTVMFLFEFRHPDAIYTDSFTPARAFTDGRVPMSITVQNFPFDIASSDVLVEFASNVSVTTISRATPDSKTATLTCTIPASSASIVITPVMIIPKLGSGTRFKFPTDFSYQVAPEPVILSILPSTAPMITAKIARLEVQSFPGVADISDIVTQFRWPDGTTAPGTVKSFVRLNSDLPPLGIQNMQFDIETPFGTSVNEGAAIVTVYHQHYRLRPCFFPGFTFIDTLGPSVSRMSTNADTYGATSVEVRTSKSTQVTVYIQNAKVQVFSVQLDGTNIDLLTSEHDAASRQAKVVFSVQKVPKIKTVSGLILFGMEHASCTSTCCVLFSCAKDCKSKTACFRLQYFDDLAPKILLMSGTQGNELGGTLVRLTISKFPQVFTIQGESSEVSAIFQDMYPGRVFVRYSSAEETSLEIETPEIPMIGTSFREVECVLIPGARPDHAIKFTYQVSAVVPELKLVYPSEGGSPGGVQVRAKIEYFPFGDDAAVEFCGVVLDGVRISPQSTRKLTEIVFTTPSTDYGTCVVKMFPKSCPNCGKTVFVDFKQIDVTIPVLEQFPVSGAMQEIPGKVEIMKMSNFPPDYTSVQIRFQGDSIDVAAAVGTVSVDANLGATIMLTPPSSPSAGKTICTITTNTPRGPKTTMTTYTFYDATKIRMLRTVPDAFPSRLNVFRQILDFDQPTTLKLANFPQGKNPDDLLIMAGSTPVTVLAVNDIASCFDHMKGIDCNRTDIFITAPAQEFSGNVILSITDSVSIPGSVLQTPFQIALPFFQPCDYEVFCRDLANKIADRQLLIQRPPEQPACSQAYCVDIKSIPEPSITSVNPTEGPTSGGTDVKINFKNFPAFVLQEIEVTVGQGASKIYGKIKQVENLGGSVLRSEGYLTIMMPPVKNMAVVRSEIFSVEVSFGGITKTLEGLFQYTPVVVGNPIIDSMTRMGALDASLFPNSDNDIVVRLSNFPFIADLTLTSKVKCLFEGKSYDASSIMASSYESTVAQFRIDGTNPGQKSISVYYEPFTVARAAAHVLTVMQPPTPTAEGFFPRLGKSGRDMPIAITIKHMSYTLTEGDYLALTVVTMQSSLAPSETTLQVEDAIVLTPATCSKNECAKVTIKCAILGSLVPKTGGDVYVTVAISAESVQIIVPFSADDTPEVRNLEPKTMDVTQTNSTKLKIYASNLRDDFCSNALACDVSFDLSKFALVDRIRAGVVEYVTYDANQHIVEVIPPKIGQSGTAVVTITSAGMQLVFDYDITMPASELTPIDSICSGAEVLSIKVIGWGTQVRLTSDVEVKVGTNMVTVLGIQSSQADLANTYSETVLSVRSPAHYGVARLSGTVALKGERESKFVLECFDEPKIKLSPAEATLDGGTLTEDGSSIQIELENFPKISSPSDLEILFGATKCDGRLCTMLDYTNTDRLSIVVVSVPPALRVGTVSVQVTYIGAVKPPIGGDKSKTYFRSAKTASAQMKYFIPAPLLIASMFCAQCNEGISCLKNGHCKGSMVPKSASMTMTAKGRMTIIIENFPQIQFDNQTGALRSPARLDVMFGDNFGLLNKVLYSDKLRSAFEVSLMSGVPKGELDTELRLLPDAASPTAFTVRFPVNFYDDSVSARCDKKAVCEGKLEGGDPFVLRVDNYVITDTALDNLLIRFDQLPASSVVAEATFARSLLTITPPSFTCSSCVTENGFATVKLSVRLRSDGDLIASSYYIFWAAPKLSDCRFSSQGTELLLTFDQPTNRARMGKNETHDETRNCSRLLSASTLNQLGEKSECIWNSESKAIVILGVGATIKPGDLLRISVSSRLTSSNGVSSPSTSSRTIGMPEIVIPPYVELKAKDVIDPCSALELRGTVSSPRPRPPFAKFSWACLNDNVFHSFLSSQTSDTVYLDSGTPPMPVLDKEYEITLVVQDFLGVSSTTKYIRVFKKSSEAPQIVFTPPFLTVTRNMEVEINGEAVFSECPMQKEDIIFRWNQILGPSIPIPLMLGAIPQLEIPADILSPGSIYEFSLQAAVTGAPSQTMQGIFTLNVIFQPLVANIANGSRIQASSLSPLLLSADGSFDPDFPEEGASDPGLNYSWSCSCTITGIKDTCRDAATQQPLVFAEAKDIQVAVGDLSEAPYPYIFRLKVSKQGRKPAFKEIEVTIVDAELPTLTIIRVGGKRLPDGVVSLNLRDRIILEGLCDKPNIVAHYRWNVSPFVNLSLPSVAPLGFVATKFILQPEPSLLTPGSRYAISFAATTTAGASSQSSLDVIVNSPPRGGTFSVCLESAKQSCIKNGISVIDEFRVACQGWADRDVPLLYQYGYESAPDPESGNITSLMMEPVKDAVRIMGFPKGSLTIFAFCIDALGGKSEMLTDVVVLEDQNSAQARRRLLGLDFLMGRRLFAAGACDFVCKAKGKLKEKLAAFRSDSVNQMAGSMSSAGGGSETGGVIMNALVSGTGRAARTNSRACESMGSAAAVSSKPSNVGASTIGGMAGMLKAMLKTKLGAVSESCASSASTATSGTLRAQAMYAKANPSTPSMLTPTQAADFINSLESGMKAVLSKTILDFQIGEPAKKVSSDGSEHTISRATATILDGTNLSQPLPSLFDKSMVANIQIPNNFGSEVFPNATVAPTVDIHLQSHGLAPAMPGWKLISPMVGLTISLAGGQEVKVTNLSRPIYITVPIDISSLNDIQKMLFTQQAQCVFWDSSNSTYSTSGCNVSEASQTSVTCHCNHLTLFAVSVDTSFGACGDGSLQANEECDDANIDDRDGCSSSCKVEDNVKVKCTCSGEPSICMCKRKKGTGTPNADGVRATAALTGFTSLDDFLWYEKQFKESIAAVVENGVSFLDVVTISVCYGSTCEIFWSAFNRRTGFSSNSSTSTSNMRSLQQTTDVKFQVNVPLDFVDPTTGKYVTNADLYQAFIFSTFLQRVGVIFSRAIGRTVTAIFIDQPGLVTEDAGGLWNKPGAGYKPDSAREPVDEMSRFVDSLVEVSGLSMGTVMAIIVLAFVFVCCSLGVFVMLPYYKRNADREERARVVGDSSQPKKRAIHHKVEIPEVFGFGFNQHTLVGVDLLSEDGEDVVPRRSRQPPKVQDFYEELLDHVDGNTDDGEEPASPDDDVAGDTEAQENAKFGYAKKRLQELQDQLDAILGDSASGMYDVGQLPFEVDKSLAADNADEQRRAGRMPPLIMGVEGGKATAITTSSSNFVLRHPENKPLSHTHGEAMDTGWMAVHYEDIMASGGRTMPVAHATVPTESVLQHAPPAGESRKPPTLSETGSRRAPLWKGQQEKRHTAVGE